MYNDEHRRVGTRKKLCPENHPNSDCDWFDLATGGEVHEVPAIISP